jgi:hypothetical protein
MLIGVYPEGQVERRSGVESPSWYLAVFHLVTCIIRGKERRRVKFPAALNLDQRWLR